MNVAEFTTDDGRSGHGVYECTGDHHHRYFPDTEPSATRDVYFTHITEQS